MADCMRFPDTVEEFMEAYKVVDTDHVYTNGVAFVPIFRMKQWFEHKPERKTGHWIEHNPHQWGLGVTFECSECGCFNLDATDYCPDCGSPMKGAE